MILVDTSVWVDHFRRADEDVRRLIATAHIALHPYVLGELALGGVSERDRGTFADLAELDEPPVGSAAELLAFIAWGRLARCGIGFVDAHLLLSARMVAGARVFTRDRRLLAQAERLQVAYRP